MTGFSSPKSLGSQCEIIVYPCSVVRPSVVSPPFSKIFFSKTTWPIKAKFHMEPPWKEGTKVCINGPGHMTRSQRTMILKLGMQHWGIMFYKFYISDDPGLTLTYFMAKQNLVAYAFEWGNLLQSNLMVKTCSK